MRLIAYNYHTGMGCFECVKCEALKQARKRIIRKCTICGHMDDRAQRINYNWRKRRVGYSRLIPTSDWKNASTSIKRAEADGMKFSTTKCFAGFRIIIEIESVYKNDPRAII